MLYSSEELRSRIDIFIVLTNSIVARNRREAIVKLMLLTVLDNCVEELKNYAGSRAWYST